ncbi:hypothetical protein 10S9_30 [uncultured Caudovirales phage]|uniref:Uncharacterized protein n=1 Tax=uncultured Caudovirales phage TaxID=2100421 RepID=A0A2H4J4W1_9CAUD|nr:hypothetical protein 10S9_30 [uncultured Caudovirales phage]
MAFRQLGGIQTYLPLGGGVKPPTENTAIKHAENLWVLFLCLGNGPGRERDGAERIEK